MTTKEQELSSLIQLCDLRPWRRALFTTYTLSVSFFEAYVLSALTKVGCSDIIIFVDHSFYLESLAERQSKSAGRDYRIVPVRMRTNGVFHPKVTYLSSDSEDFVAVGSGNLTYAGQGVNLECLDVLSSAANPSVFLDIADFFTAVLDSNALELCAERERLIAYRDRARQIGRSSPSPARPKVLHSIGRSISVQVTEQLEAFRPLKRVVCMAPFHHPQGEPVFDLAQALGATRIDIGLDPVEQLAPFSAPDPARKRVRTRYVVPAGEENHRALHAKWYEFHGETSHVLTGSVNATATALNTTENVEVAVLRQIDPSEALRWIEKKPIGTKDRTFKALSSLFDGFVTASISNDDLLRGTVHVATPAGPWEATVYSRHREWSFGQAIVEADGTFSLKVPEAFAAFREIEEAAHLRLHRDEVTVAGWIAFEFDLDAPPDLRGARRALDRLSRGQTRRGDIEQIVQWFCSVIGPLNDRLAGGGQGERNATSADKPRDRSASLSYDEWAQPQSRQRILYGDVGAMFRKTLAVLSAGRDELISRARKRGHLAGLSQADDELESEYAAITEYDLLPDVVEAIDRALARTPNTPLTVELLHARLLLTLRPIFSREEDFTSAGVRSFDWLRLVRGLNLRSEFRRDLIAIAWALAGIALALAPVEAASGQAATLKQLMETLARDLPPVEPKRAAEDAFQQPLLSAAPSSLAQGSLSAVDRILEASTIREELKSFLKERSAGGHPTPSAALTQTLPARVLQKLGGGIPPIVVPDPSVDRCPDCYTGIERGVLRTRRAVQCMFCGRVLVWLGI